MKFGHEFEVALQQEDYPNHWLESAISYKQLKKCIKDVQGELTSIGLDPATVSQLWRTMGSTATRKKPFEYTFAGNVTAFRPKLIFCVDTSAGILIDASVAPETKMFLEAIVARNRELSACEGFTSLASDVPHTGLAPAKAERDTRFGSHSETTEYTPQDLAVYQAVEIPLRTDSHFFQLLRLEMSGLQDLQSKEEAELGSKVESLATDISKVAEPSSSVTKTDLYAWREIFSLYADANVFFSTNERDEHSRSSLTAENQLTAFSSRLLSLGLTKNFKRKESRSALDEFLRINMTLLRHIKFQELNVTAMTKILKKFDKRTSLSAREAFLYFPNTAIFSSASLAKAVCFKVSEQLLKVVPQLDDYLCPVCYNISFKPIRLRCGHVFCLRCMIVMQRAKNDHCPLCRDSVVMQADSANLDGDLMNKLRRYFPTEVKIKQKENERALAIDKYGKDSTCVLM